jgi:hypothetical protein
MDFWNLRRGHRGNDFVDFEDILSELAEIRTRPTYYESRLVKQHIIKKTSYSERQLTSSRHKDCLASQIASKLQSLECCHSRERN